MELHFAELEQSEVLVQPNQKNKKNGITYDDILSSLNLKVNNGKLEYIQPSPSLQPSPTNCNNSLKTCYKKQQIQEHQQPNNPYQNNYIYNKYFKDYKYPNIQEEPIYVTPEEYKKRLVLEMIRRREEQIRISQIKTKKLLFAQKNNTPPQVSTPNHDLNKLFRFSR